ncbi:intradiol ring-cleavage dioxygenase [Deinococcus sp.]|uniref:dioxygenase family protein n=1 Tax=Deinococcus sp. TaxID=47478 RepID=UPI003C7B2661
MVNPIVHPYPADEHDPQGNFNDLGLNADLGMLVRPVMDRRRVLALGLLGIGLLVGCGSGTGSTPTTSTGGGTDTGNTGTADCPSAVPTETAGPYPADGSVASGHSVNALTKSGIVRSDLRTSLATGKVAAGVPLTLTLKLVNTNAGCAAVAGYAVYVWHCDQGGNYSLYSSVVNEDYLRGVQVTDSTGAVTFSTIFPACYSGRWPHIHFEVYPSMAHATSASNKIQT